MFEKLESRFDPLGRRRTGFLEIAGAAVLVLLAVGKEFLPEIFSHYIPEPKTLLSIAFLFCAFAFLVAVDTNLKIRALTGGISLKRMPLAEGMMAALANGPCKTVTIYAISSRNIQTLLASNKYRIDSARVLLWQPNALLHGADVHQHYSSEIEHVILSGWKSAQSRSVFSRTTIRRYADLPDIYFVVFDRKLALLGFYRRNADPYNVVDYSDVLIFDGKNDETNRTIDWLLLQFDSMWTQSGNEVAVP